MTYHHTVIKTPRGWCFQIWDSDKPDGSSTPMNSHKIADLRGREHVAMMNYEPRYGGGIEAQLAELGL
jgi:hypothetical protein